MRGSFVFANDRGGSTDEFNNGSAVLQEGLYNASSRPSYSSSTFTTSNCRPLVNLGPPKPPPLDDIPNKIWAIFNSNRTPYRPFPHLPSGPRPPKNMGHQYPLISSIGADAPRSQTPSRPDRKSRTHFSHSRVTALRSNLLPPHASRESESGNSTATSTPLPRSAPSTSLDPVRTGNAQYVRIE